MSIVNDVLEINKQQELRNYHQISMWKITNRRQPNNNTDMWKTHKINTVKPLSYKLDSLVHIKFLITSRTQRV
jgi:hypothetical protein